MNRRRFVRLLVANASVLRGAASAEQPLLYFVDGYHGGVRGHMPAGAWRDIVTRLHTSPEWKLCLDIEAASWIRVAEDDPVAFDEIKGFLRQPHVEPRIEMVGGTFAQPYGWAIGGESNIRQLVRGLQVIRESFPNLPVDTYAMQEPCWASCLPQILRSLGFKNAVLKNPSTAWGGYSVGFDAETVNWIGPDGTSIRTVPRYACEDLLDTWRTEAQSGSRAFAQKCVAHGIRHPAGMCFQDLGWAARPNVEGSYIRFVTWREYMHSVAAATIRDWRFGIEDIRCALPWGEKTLQQIARQVRSAEERLLAAEKIAALARAFAKQPYPTQDLQQAWDKTLWSQHHDCWITATTKTGRDAWAFQVAAQTWDAEMTCRAVVDRSLDRLRRGPGSAVPPDPFFLHVFNTQAHDRYGLVEVDISASKGTKAFRIRDAAGKIVPSQFIITRKYLTDSSDRVHGNTHQTGLGPGESVGAARLVFNASVPATGSSVYSVEDESAVETSSLGASAKISSDGSVDIETDLYRIHIDAAHGGTITRLFAKSLDFEFCAAGERRLHEFRGYFIEESAWQSSATVPASLELLEPGPIRVSVAIRGFVGSVPFRSVVTLVQSQKRIDFDTQFHFEKDTWIGDPYEMKPSERRTDRRRSEYDDRFKLLALFPTSLSQQRLYKNAAFDACESKNTDTFFQSWDTIKHNIIVNWVDVHDEENDRGLGLFSDHTTSYAHGPDHPLSLVIGWGWEGGYWWGKCPLNGLQQLHYSLIPHSGRWQQARLWRETFEWPEPLLARLSAIEDKSIPGHLVSIQEPGVYLSAAFFIGTDLLLRFFNGESDAKEHTVTLGLACKAAYHAEHDGAPIRPLAITRMEPNLFIFVLTIPLLGLQTVRLTPAQ